MSRAGQRLQKEGPAPPPTPALGPNAPTAQRKAALQQLESSRARHNLSWTLHIPVRIAWLDPAKELACTKIWRLGKLCLEGIFTSCLLPSVLPFYKAGFLALLLHSPLPFANRDGTGPPSRYYDLLRPRRHGPNQPMEHIIRPGSGAGGGGGGGGCGGCVPLGGINEKGARVENKSEMLTTTTTGTGGEYDTAEKWHRIQLALAYSGGGAAQPGEATTSNQEASSRGGMGIGGEIKPSEKHVRELRDASFLSSIMKRGWHFAPVDGRNFETRSVGLKHTALPQTARYEPIVVHKYSTTRPGTAAAPSHLANGHRTPAYNARPNNVLFTDISSRVTRNVFKFLGGHCHDCNLLRVVFLSTRGGANVVHNVELVSFGGRRDLSLEDGVASRDKRAKAETVGPAAGRMAACPAGGSDPLPHPTQSHDEQMQIIASSRDKARNRMPHAHHANNLLPEPSLRIQEGKDPPEACGAPDEGQVKWSHRDSASTQGRRLTGLIHLVAVFLYAVHPK
ncbi:hypothetical protein BJV74DRAFT_795781 [Russula compacta]|nr:hypothetical protein BJV74DRAFT_795781 [Russula compacta]